MKLVLAVILALSVAAGIARADPGIDVYTRDGIQRVSLKGSYPGAQYLVWRSDGAQARFVPMNSDLTLCTGECFALDLRVEPGVTYFYRFDLSWPDGSSVSYGPYAVAVPDPPLGIRLWPNPVRTAASLELTLPGSRRADPVPAEARVVDLRGRTLRVLASGPMLRGTTRLSWDGLDQAGQRLRPGTYFVRLTSALGSRSVRFVAL